MLSAIPNPVLYYLSLTAVFIFSAKVFVTVLNRLKAYTLHKRINKISTLFSTLYTGINGFKASTDHRTRLNEQNENYTYGEILFDSFSQILQAAQPLPNDIFYDLGCGTGKAVVATALLYHDINARGVEILPPLYTICESVKEKYRQLPNNHSTSSVDFFHADFFEYDFSDGNIVFINATSINQKTWNALSNKLHLLPKGARIILSTKSIDDSRFKLIHSGLYLMSWGHSAIRIYKKTA